MSNKIDNVLILNEIKRFYSLETKVEFSNFLGVVPSTLSSWYTRNSIDWELIFAKCVDIDLDSLIRTGTAKKRVTDVYPENNIQNIVNAPIINEFSLQTDLVKPEQRIPLFDVEAAAGLVPLFTEAVKHIPINYIQIPNLPKCDGAIYITGDSMYPLLKSGDIVLYKVIHDIKNSIFWGEMYLLSVIVDGEEYILVKYIQKADDPDYVRLVSENRHHSDKEVLIENIRALALIKASVRINSMR